MIHLIPDIREQTSARTSHRLQKPDNEKKTAKYYDSPKKNIPFKQPIDNARHSKILPLYCLSSARSMTSHQNPPSTKKKKKNRKNTAA